MAIRDLLVMPNYQRISRNHLCADLRLHNDRLGGYRFDAELGNFCDELEVMKWQVLKLAGKLQITGLLNS